MTEDTEYLGHEAVEGETPFSPRRYKVQFACSKCGHQWHRTYKAVPKKDPPCPNKACAQASRLVQAEMENHRLRKMLEEGRGPAQTGHRVITKAIDQTAEITMQDYGLTNLKDNIREGEAMAPPLPPVQQQQADNYFGKSGTFTDRKAVDFATGSVRTVRAGQMERIARRALAGGYSKMAVGPTAVVPHAVKGQPALTMVRSEKLK